MFRYSISAIHERWSDWHPLIRLCVVLATLAALGFIAIKPAFRAFKDWRVGKNLENARKAAGHHRMQDARDFSLAVIQSGKPGIEAWRILEKSTASLRDPRHGDVARMLLNHPQGSVDDRLTGFLTIAAEAPLGVVGQAWVALPPECRPDPRFARAFADRLISGRRNAEAASVLLAVPLEHRTGAVNRGLVRTLIGSGTREGFDQAQRLIVEGFAVNGVEMSEWLEVLESIPALSLQPSLLDPIRTRLRDASSGNSARLELMDARIDYASANSRRSEVLDTAIQRWKDADPVALARFLSDLGFSGMLLETFSPQRVEEIPELLPWMLAALEDTGSWDEVSLLLDCHGHLLPKAEVLAHRAIVISKTGASAGQPAVWTSAIEEAKTAADVNGLLKLHRLAADAGMRDEADSAMIAAIRSGRGPLPLYSELKPLLASLQQLGRENAILEICAIYLQFEPGNPVLLTQYAYLACLQQLVDPATILKALVPLSEAYPGEQPIQIVLATVYLCDQQHAKAAEILKPLNLDPARLPPSYRIVLLATQVLNRQKSPDDPMVRDFPWKSLLPSERRKFSELIRNADP